MPARIRPRPFVPRFDSLGRREMPAGLGGIAGVAWGLYELYGSAPVKAVRTVALGGKLARLAWTGEARFALGLVRVSQPRPLARGPHVRRRLSVRLAARRGAGIDRARHAD
jgi:hypothetical protein